MFMNVETPEQAESCGLKFLLSKAFGKAGFDRWSDSQFAGLVLDNCDAAAWTKSRAQAAKILNAILDVVIGIDEQYEIEVCGRQMGRGEGC